MEKIFYNYEQLLAEATNIAYNTTFTEHDFPKKHSVKPLSQHWYTVCEQMAKAFQSKYGDDYILTYETEGPMRGTYRLHRESE